MADFPPNLEDGELWLPSDVIHEITYSPLPPTPPPPPPPPASPPPPTTFCPNSLPSNIGSQVHYAFMDASTGGSFYGDHLSDCAALYGGYQLATPPIFPYCIPITQHMTQGLEEKGGTGVFLPRAVVVTSEKKSKSEGTGVLFNNQTKNKKSGKSKGAFKSSNEKKSNKKEGGWTKKDKSQSQHYPTKKVFPKDWKF